MGEAPLTEKVAALLAGEGVRARDIRLRALREGGNNQVFVAEAETRAFVVKRYFTHPGDPRDRLASEYAFTRCATAIGVGSVPRPIACDARDGIAVYEFVAGRKLTGADLEDAHVEQAARFLEAINSPRARVAAAQLPQASEAAFSLSGHIDILDQRMARLATIEPASDVDRAAAAFVGVLRDGWRRLRRRLLDEAARSGALPDDQLPEAQRIVSPSDFGFHNAVLRPDEGITFVDFEYAGWDDPAKTVGDFFSQPAVPIPERHFERIAAAATCFIADNEEMLRRARQLLPMFRLKWCCIMLNHFTPVSRERRRFAGSSAADPEVKWRQLEKARSSFSSIGI